MRILPVLDLLRGDVVRGVAGRRETYRPIESRLTDRTDAVAVAQAFREHFGFEELYVADLDGILTARPNLGILRELSRRGFACRVDAGIRTLDDARTLRDAGVERLVVCLESNPGEAFLATLVNEFSTGQLCFSLDLLSEQPMGRIDDRDENPAATVDRIAVLGFREVILLDLAAVGVGSGPATASLCRAIRDRHPSIELITGGGVRDANDLRRLAEAGANGVLLASALHSGALTPADLAPYLGDQTTLS